MNKILIIGQAPPIQAQAVPYDTTMLYDWLELAGVNKSRAQEIFIFDAVSNTIPEVTQAGHKPPTQEHFQAHWPALSENIKKVDKVILLGAVAKKFMWDYVDSIMLLKDRQVLELMHPSKRNYHAFSQNKTAIIRALKSFITLSND